MPRVRSRRCWAPTTRRRPRARRRRGRGRSCRARSSASSSSLISSARSAPSSCSIVRGPMIGAVTAGWCSSQASATSAGLLAELGAQRLPRLELRAVLLDLPLRVLAASAGPRCLARSAPPSKPPRERAPGDQAQPVACGRRDHLELDRSRVQVVEALLGHQPERVPRARGLVGAARCASRRSSTMPT